MDGTSMAGGGSLPTREIPTVLVGIRATIRLRSSPRGTPPAGRGADHRPDRRRPGPFDLRTLDAEEFAEIRDALKAAASEGTKRGAMMAFPERHDHEILLNGLSNANIESGGKHHRFTVAPEEEGAPPRSLSRR